MDNISKDFDFQSQNRKRHQGFVFQSWKVTLDHIKSHSRSLKLVWPLWQFNSVNPHIDICPSSKCLT